MSCDLAAKKFLMSLEMAQGDPKAIAGALSTFELYGSKAFTKAMSIHNEFWINGILGGFVTQSANLLGNMAKTVLMPLERMIGGAVSLNGSAVRRGFRELVGINYALMDVFKLGLKASDTGVDSTLTAVGRSLRHETPILDSFFHGGEKGAAHAITGANFGLKQGNMVGGLIDAVGAFVRWPTRVLTSADELFKQVNYRSVLRAQGLEEAEKAGLMTAGKSQQMAEFLDDYMRKGFDPTGGATNASALARAQQATFTNELTGKLTNDLMRVLGRHPVLRPVVPFFRTPVNIMKDFWQYTPGLNALNGEFRRALLSNDPLVRSAALGKAVIGAGATYMVYQAASSGMLTGSGPANPQQRAALMATGWRPYSFVVNNPDGSSEYIDYRRIDPFSTLIGLVADINEAATHIGDPDYHGLFTAITMSVGKNVTSKTYLRGISELITVLDGKDANAIKKVLQNRLGSYVPGYVSAFNNDPHQREIREWVDAIRRRVPGISQELPPRRDIFGDPIAIPMGYALDGEPESGAPRLSPFGYSKRLKDPVKEELAKLVTNTPGSHGIGQPPKSMGDLDLTKIKNANGQDAHDRLIELTGQVTIRGRKLHDALSRLIESKFYKDLPDIEDRTADTFAREQRIRSVQKVFSEYRDEARRQLVKEYPEIQDYKRQREKAARLYRNPRIAKILNAVE